MWSGTRILYNRVRSSYWLGMFISRLAWFLGWRGLVLLLMIGLIRAGSNLLYYDALGPLSSAGADIWFFIGVVKGDYHLFWGDPLQWVLPRLGGLSIPVIFTSLLVFSSMLNGLAVLLLFFLLRDLYGDGRAAFWTALAYGCISSSFLFSTGTFLHQQASLPLMMALVWVACRFSMHADANGRGLKLGGMAVLALFGSAIGPDVWVVILTLAICGVVRQFRGWGTPARRRLVVTAGLVLMAGAVVLLGEPVRDLVARLASTMRGIDLATQKSLFVGDLMPLNIARWLGNYSFLSYGILALLIFAAWRDRLLEVTAFVAPFLLATQAVRFFFITEIGIAVLLGWLFFEAGRHRAGVANFLGVVVVIAFIWLEGARGATCLCPSTLISSLSRIRDDPTPKKLVVCNPSYGFVVRAWANAAPTADMQHLDSNTEWMRLLTLPSEKAVAELKKGGVTHLLLTTHDFKQAVERTPEGGLVSGTYASGGLERFLPKLSDEELKRSLLYEAFTELFRAFPVSGISLVVTARDPKTGLGILLYRIE